MSSKRGLLLLLFCAWFVGAADKPIVLSYYPSYLKLSPGRANIPYDRVTHFCWAFSQVDSAGNMTFWHEEAIDEFIDSVTAHGNTPLLSIGGCTTIDDFKIVMQSPQTMANYCDSVVYYCKQKGFKGVEVNWEGDNLVEWKNKNELHWPNFKQAYSDFVVHLGQKLHAEDMTIGVDVYSTHYFGQHYPGGEDSLFIATVDRFLMMTGGKHGAWELNHPWTAKAEHHGNMEFVQENIDYWVNRDVPIGKVVPSYVGSFFGYNVKGASNYGARYDTLGQFGDQAGNVFFTKIDSLLHSGDDGMYLFGGGAKGSVLYYPFEEGNADNEFIFFNSYEDFRYMSQQFLQQGIQGLGYWNFEVDLPADEDKSLIAAITEAFTSEDEFPEPEYIPFDQAVGVVTLDVETISNGLQVVGRSLELNLNEQQFSTVSLHSVSGRVLWQQSLAEKSGLVALTIPENIATGLYLLHISSTNSSLQRSVLLK